MIDASHFSMVGFLIDLRDQQSLGQTIQPFLKNCQYEQVSQTDSICQLKDPSGGTLLIGLRRDANGHLAIFTMNPAFEAEGRTKVTIKADVSDPDQKPFEASLSAQFSGSATPLVFDVDDPTQLGKLKPGSDVTVDIAAFSFQPQIYPDSASYMKAQTAMKTKDGKTVMFADSYFMPSGMFFAKVGGAMPDDAPRPLAYADFAGTVLKSELRANAIGSSKFWWALVKTYNDATFDVVMDPSTINTEPKVGSIVTGRFWLSAQIAPSR